MTTSEWREFQQAVYGFEGCEAPPADRDGCVAAYRRGSASMPYPVHLFDLNQEEKTVSVRFARGHEGIALWVMLELQRYGYFVTGVEA